MIPTEANYVEWFTCSARYYLLKEGFAFLTFGVEQIAEPGFPAAKLLAAGNRLLGLRFLRPVEPDPGQRVSTYEAEPGLLDQVHERWTLCALPQSADVLDQQLTHQKVTFAPRDELERLPSGTLASRSGSSFRQVFERIVAGALGRELPVGWSSEDLAAAAAEQPVSLYLVVDARDRIVFALYGRGGSS